MTFGGGRNLGLDHGSINYGVPLHTEWYRSAIAHGSLKDRTVKDGVTTLAAEAGKVYPGVKLAGSRIHDWAFHARG